MAPNARSFLPSLFLTLSCASSQMPTERQPQLDELRVCKAESVQRLVGEQASEPVVRRALALSGSSTSRIVHPGQPLAMDFITDRLTIEVDRQGSIIRLYCQ